MLNKKKLNDRVEILLDLYKESNTRRAIIEGTGEKNGHRNWSSSI